MTPLSSILDTAPVAALRAINPKLFVLDVDSTLITQEVIELLAAYAGKEEEVREITESAMRGELDFASSLRHRVATLQGLPLSVCAEVFRAIQLSPGAQELITGVHAAGGYIAAVSGGFTQILDPLAAGLGLDASKANLLGSFQDNDGVVRLSGEVEGDIVDRAAKAKMLQQWAGEFQVPREATVAIGDGANDLEMLATAALGLAYRAKPVVAEAADATINRLDEALVLL